MDKSKLNVVIDALMFLCLMAMAGLGFLMKYVLPSGRDAWAKYGSNLQFSWLGWDRHDWGDIHLYLAFFLLGLLVLHIILHWSQILGLFQRLVPNPRQRYRIALIFLLLSLLLIYFPFLITPDSKARGPGGRRSQVGGVVTVPAKPVGFLRLQGQGFGIKIDQVPEICETQTVLGPAVLAGTVPGRIGSGHLLTACNGIFRSK
jgi:hypothetical protein